MPYTINKSSGAPLVVLEDGTLDISTSLGLLGRNYTGYGEVQNENFVHLLENFANDNPPGRPLPGQIWYQTSSENLNVYDGTEWKPVGSASVSATSPVSSEGALWLDSATDQLYVFNGDLWTLIGPEAVNGYGTTRLVARKVLGSDNVEYAILTVVVDGVVIAIQSSHNFDIDATNIIPGFTTISIGTTLSSAAVLRGNVIGNAESADRLSTPRKINNVNFDGQADISITAPTTGILKKGTYLTGSNFNGTADTTWAVDATPDNTIGTVVARNAAGDFSAGTITADIIGDVSGNVTTTQGTSTFDVVVANEFVGISLSGNAFSATKLQTSRNINGVSFDGTNDVVVPAAAGTLTGTILNPTVTQSSLNTVGVLGSLRVQNPGIEIGTSNQLKIFMEGSTTPTIKDVSGFGIELNVVDTSIPSGVARVRMLSASASLAAGGVDTNPSIAPNASPVNLGLSTAPFNKVYASTVASPAIVASVISTTRSDNTVNVASNLLVDGNLVVQGSINSVSSTALEIADKTITLSDGATNAAVASGSGIKVDGAAAEFLYSSTGDKWTVNKDLDLGSKRLYGAATLNSLSMTGYVNLHANPVSPLHAATKQYVDTNAAFTITYGQTYSQSGFTNQVGSWNFGANFFDVFPPAGKSMGNLVAFMPSIAVIHFAGGVNGDDSMVCTYSYLGDRIRVYVQNTEQRSTPAANWIAFWR